MTPIRRETLGGQLFELLRHRILTGELSGGCRLVQGELAGELRVSRIPVRDALRRLEAEGLVEGDDVGQYTVIPFTRDDAAEIYAIQRRLELLAAALAARKARNEELDEIRTLFETMDSVVREAGPKLYVDHNARFHMAIYEPSGVYPVEIRWPARAGGLPGLRWTTRPSRGRPRPGRGPRVPFVSGDLGRSGCGAEPTRARKRTRRPEPLPYLDGVNASRAEPAAWSA